MTNPLTSPNEGDGNGASAKRMFDLGVYHGLRGAIKAARESAKVFRATDLEREAAGVDALADALQNAITKAPTP